MEKKGWLQWAILLLLVMTWGSSFILMKKGLLVFSALQVGAMRMGMTFLFLLPFMFLRIKKIRLKQWYMFLICGLIGNGIPAFLFAYAQTGIDSSLSGILNSLTPLFTMILGMLFFGYRGKWYNIAGVFIALAGATGLMAVSGKGDLSLNFSFGIFIVIATLCYAININLIKKYFTDTDAISITTYAIGSIGIPALLFLFLGTDFTVRVQSLPGAGHALLMIAILSIVGTGLAMMLYNYLIKISNVVFVASVTYLMPVVAIFWGVTDGEAFSPFNILWISLVLLGVGLVNTRRKLRHSAR
jgi:drug/metabolite transporter (DMT)-like permease